MNPFLKFVLALVAVLVLLFVVLTFAAGPMVRGVINDKGPQLLGRKVHVDDVSINFFTGSFQLDSLMVAEADGVTPFMSVRKVRASISIPRLLFGTYSLNDVDVDRLRLEVQQRDTVFNFSDILDLLASDEADDSPLPLVLRNINIHNSHIHYQDLLVRSDFRINDFSLFIPGVDLRDISTSVGMQLSLGDGGQLSTRLDYDERTHSYRVNLQLEGFNLQSILPYVRQQIAFGELAGTLNLDLEMKGDLRHMLDFSLRGTAGVRGLNVLDPDGHPMVQCDTVAIGVRNMDLKQNRIELSQILFDRPDIRIAYGKDSLDNFTRLMTAEALASEAALPADDLEAETSVSFNGRQKELRLLIDQLAIQQARLSYRDESLQADPFVYQLADVNFHASSFTLNGINHLTANARLGQQGTLEFRYDGPITDQRNIRMSVMADNVDFSEFSPYTVQMFGNEVSGGTLSVNMAMQTVNGQLMSQNRFILRDPKVEKKRRDVSPEMNIPFRAGMYLLTDRNDVCDIDLPVHGNLDEPRFSYKRLIFRTLGKLIVKVVTSPFRRQKSASGDELSAGELLQLDNRSLESISLDSLSTEILSEE